MATSTAPSPQAMQQLSPLARLPAEIRVMIYGHALTEPYRNILDVSDGRIPEPPLMQVSRLCREEAGQVFYSGANTVFLTLLDEGDASRYQEKQLAQWASATGERWNVKVAFYCCGMSERYWNNLLTLARYEVRRRRKRRGPVFELSEFAKDQYVQGRFVRAVLYAAYTTARFPWSEVERDLELICTDVLEQVVDLAGNRLVVRGGRDMAPCYNANIQAIEALCTCLSRE